MYHRAYSFDIIHFVDKIYVCVLYETQNKQLLFMYRAVTVEFFIIEECVYSAVRAETLNIGLFNSRYLSCSQCCEKRILASSCSSAWNKSAPTGRIFMKFYI
jgi:hypothetical protein